MDKALLCPLLMAACMTSPNSLDTKLGVACRELKCAWWDRELEKCAIFMLKNIHDALCDIQ